MFSLPLLKETGMLAASDSVFNLAIESPGYGVVKSVSMLPWDVIAEPFKTQIISITSFSVAGKELNLDDFDITWELPNDFIVYGNPGSFELDTIGVYDCTVTATSIKDSEKYSQSFQLASKYVRREIRSLTDDDRQLFFDALHEIYSVNSETGKNKYGSKFQTAEYFLFKHLTGAGVSNCDHWHDGAGLVGNHMALTLEVEQVGEYYCRVLLSCTTVVYYCVYYCCVLLFSTTVCSTVFYYCVYY